MYISIANDIIIFLAHPAATNMRNRIRSDGKKGFYDAAIILNCKLL